MNRQWLKYLPCVLLFAGLLLGGRAGAAQDAGGAIKTAAAKIEKAILEASELHERGKIQKDRPLIVPVASDLRLVFREDHFDADLEKAFQILDRFMTRIKADKVQPAAARPVSPPTPTAQKTAPPPSQAPDRLTALMQAEKETDRVKPSNGTAPVPLDYSVYGQYRHSRLARMQENEKMIEAEKQAIIAERQAAAQRQQRRRERDQQLQSQATAWQAELDKQAKASAAAALQWQQENSFGAYMKRFLGMVVQTSVGAFTGGFFGTVSTNLANKAVGRLFPAATTDIYTQAASAGTSAAITQTGTAVGQQAVSSALGQGAATQGTATSGTGATQYQPPQY